MEIPGASSAIADRDRLGNGETNTVYRLREYVRGQTPHYSEDGRVTKNRKGGIDIVDNVTGRGVRYNSDGDFVSFLEP